MPYDMTWKRGKPRSHRKFDDEQERVICERYIAGESALALAREFVCSDITLRRVLGRNNVSRRRGPGLRSWTQAQVAEIKERWYAGESQHSIGKSLGVSQTAISKLLLFHGIPPVRRTAVGSRVASWKGGRVGVAGGYLGVLVNAADPMASMRQSAGYVLEHRLVMARAMGRPLTPQESVHHINGDRQDNRIENLQLRTGSHGKGAAMCCADCGSSNIVPISLT